MTASQPLTTPLALPSFGGCLTASVHVRTPGYCAQLSGLPFFGKLGGVKDTAAFKKTRDIYEDMRERYETTDHPAVHKVGAAGVCMATELCEPAASLLVCVVAGLCRPAASLLVCVVAGLCEPAASLLVCVVAELCRPAASLLVCVVAELCRPAATGQAWSCHRSSVVLSQLPPTPRQSPPHVDIVLEQYAEAGASQVSFLPAEDFDECLFLTCAAQCSVQPSEWCACVQRCSQ